MLSHKHADTLKCLWTNGGICAIHTYVLVSSGYIIYKELMRINT